MSISAATRRVRSSATVLLMSLLMFHAIGCQTLRTVTIVTEPEDAMIKINGVDYGRGPVTHQFRFEDEDDVHRITASRIGFKEQTEQLRRDDTRKIVEIQLRPQTRRIDFAVRPVPGVIKINGRQVTPQPVDVHSEVLEFTVDQHRNWTNYTVTAEREGYRPAQTNVTWSDPTNEYTLNLRPYAKDLSITSTPPGAQVYLNDELIGTTGSTPLVVQGREFPYDPATGQFAEHELRLHRAGFDDVTKRIGWDDGRGDYHFDFTAKQKVVRIRTDPPGAQVSIKGEQPVSSDEKTTVYKLQFPPVNEKGELKVYEGVARKEAKNAEWEPAPFSIAWDEGKQDYQVTLKEIISRPVPLLVASMRRTDNGWECVPEQKTTTAMKDTSEPSNRPQPEALARPGKDKSIGSMAMAPDGSRVLYTVLAGSQRSDFRSQMFAVSTDGKTLDITPSFSPGGEKILFSSNRAGWRMQIWSMSSRGEQGVTRETSSQTNDLWPSLDSDPKPRLFYQAMVDTRGDARIYMTPLTTVRQTDLTILGGTQPRVGPRNDAVLFCVANEQTGKRDIYRMSDSGANPQNLTNTPDADECDPTWSRDGRRIAYASDRGMDREGRRNYDIWVLDLARPEQPIQVTVNGSVDDIPLFAPTGDAIYFRSNRGGEWGVWKVDLK